jgi:type II secretory pathway pseudopilin PulG
MDSTTSSAETWRLPAAESGFTIVELMIATSVLSMMLLIVTLIITSIGNLYYKGVNLSRIQDDTRNITSQVSQDLELNNSFGTFNTTNPNPGSTEAYCIGNVRYTFVVGKELGNNANESHHVLWRDTNPTPGGACGPVGTFPNPASNGSELVAPSSRLTQFSIAGISPYHVAVNVAYGDDDLLCSPSVSGSCQTPNAMPTVADFTKGDLLCKGLSSTGSSFCATASLNTTVVQRLTQGN